MSLVLWLIQLAVIVAGFAILAVGIDAISDQVRMMRLKQDNPQQEE